MPIHSSATFALRGKAKLVSEAWKKLSGDERKKYEDMAAEDKVRYEKEMESYTPPKGEGSSKKAGKGKKKKDKDAPKKGLSAYMFFSKDKREEIKKANPDASFGEVGKLVGEAWKKLGDEEKKPYEASAAEDKERHEKELKAYKAKKKEEEAAKLDSGDSDDSDSDDSDSDSDSD